jgi:hypothetical protein
MGGSEAGTKGRHDLDAIILLLIRLVFNGNGVIRQSRPTEDLASSFVSIDLSPSSMVALGTYYKPTKEICVFQTTIWVTLMLTCQ